MVSKWYFILANIDCRTELTIYVINAVEEEENNVFFDVLGGYL